MSLILHLVLLWLIANELALLALLAIHSPDLEDFDGSTR